MRVLVVEDEIRMAGLIRQGLMEEAFSVDVVHDGDEVRDWVESAEYDVIILDIMLPGKNGWDICEDLRARGYVMPILMLTARDEIQDRVKGLNLGADDYLVKPFAIEELTARVHALGRRKTSNKSSQLQVGNLVLDTITKKAKRGDTPIAPLTLKEYQLLEVLMRHPNRILSREKIAENLWDFSYSPESKVIEVHIFALRKKIDFGYKKELIQTVRGFGYKISTNE